MLAKKIVNYRQHMAGITQNKHKCLIFMVVPQGRKNFSQIRYQNEEKVNIKKKISK